MTIKSKNKPGVGKNIIQTEQFLIEARAKIERHNAR